MCFGSFHCPFVTARQMSWPIEKTRRSARAVVTRSVFDRTKLRNRWSTGGMMPSSTINSRGSGGHVSSPDRWYACMMSARRLKAISRAGLGKCAYHYIIIYISIQAYHLCFLIDSVRMFCTTCCFHVDQLFSNEYRLILLLGYYIE